MAAKQKLQLSHKKYKYFFYSSFSIFFKDNTAKNKQSIKKSRFYADRLVKPRLFYHTQKYIQLGHVVLSQIIIFLKHIKKIIKHKKKNSK